MFSGGYIGGIALATLKTAASDGLFGSRPAEGLNGIAELSTRDLDFFLKDPRNPSHLLGGILKGADERDYELVYRILDSFTERAALFTAATMSAAVLKADKGSDPSRPVCITLEGTTYYETKNIRNRTEYYLKSFLEREKGKFTEICKVDSSSLKGRPSLL
jgi:hexokinase